VRLKETPYFRAIGSQTASRCAAPQPVFSLVESRLKGGPGAEREKSQKTILMLASIFACGLIVVPGIERRFHALIIPLPLVLVADTLIVTEFLIVFLVLRENSYASSIVEVKAGQRVISTGPYSIVRTTLGRSVTPCRVEIREEESPLSRWGW
jgi:protein-S-isoprenylcysteine O-methyltransferase Ste14